MVSQPGAQTVATTFSGAVPGGGRPSSGRTEAAHGPLAVSPRFQGARLASGLALGATDIAAFAGCVLLVLLARMLIWEPQPLFWGLGPLLASWLLFRLVAGLYPPFGMPQPEELRRSAATTALAMLSHFVLLVASGEVASYRIIGLLVWPLLVPATYFARAAMRSLLVRRGRYCQPCIVVGQGALAQAAIRELQADPELGIVPVAVFGAASSARAPAMLGVPVFGPVEELERHAFPWPVQRALIALGPQDAGRGTLEETAAALTRHVPRVQVLSETSLYGNLWARPRPIGPYLATEVRQARFSARQRRAKRAFDLLVAVPLLVAVSPVIGIAALAVKLASPGPAFFSQVREGEDGQPIRIHKLRSMVPDAQARLQEYLAADPAARFEYERTLKLRHDPRIIPRIGHLLRRSSIDELPQLWNIVRGDMSLVGPRIMPTREIELYSPTGQALRRNVPPGLTGLWQVTARSNSDLKVREIADSFYVSNWSVWLDAWILLRTVRAVLAGSGAY